LALHFRNLRGQTLLRDIPDIRFVFSVTEKRPGFFALSLFLLVSHAPIGPSGRFIVRSPALRRRH
jgi:hypothetical protein